MSACGLPGLVQRPLALRIAPDRNDLVVHHD
jgi:hypothetical protein